MIGREQFKSQISRLSVLFMREVSREHLDELWGIFKIKDFEIFEKSVSDIIRNEDKFPSPSVLQAYYDINLPPKEEPLDREDLKKAAKTQKHKEYVNLIFDLIDRKISIEDPRVQKCLYEQGDKRTFSHYDKEKKCFVKMGRAG